MQKVVSFGEVMLRLSTPDCKRFIQSTSFDASYGGAEANVIVNLVNLGFTGHFVTKVPDNELGDAAISTLNKYQVNTQNIARGGERLGAYFLETSMGVRGSKVIYDRKDSAISKALASDFDFEQIFKECKLFHFSGITPALSEAALVLTKTFLAEAKKRGILISMDVNYRSKLWDMATAQKVLRDLAPSVDICFGLLEFQEQGLADFTDNDYIDIFARMSNDFGFSAIAMTKRDILSSSTHKLYGMLYTGNTLYKSKVYDLEILDRVGTGDAFTAGILYGLLENLSAQRIIDFATAASAIKHTVSGDFNLATLSEINNLAISGGMAILR